jgi:hypothetical protein
MNHYVYQITNNINSKIYVGVRSCECDPNEDKYMGSGVAIIRAHNKYGLDNFTKEIISTFDTRELANIAEAEIVTLEFCDRPDTYNMREGGTNGLLTEEQKTRISETRSGIPAWNKGIPRTEDEKRRMSENRMGVEAWNKGIPRDQETKDKISKTRLERKIESPFKGRKHTPESLAKLKDKVVSEEVKNKMSESCRNQERYNCIHCGTECTAGNLKRWHNDNCKHK